MVQQVGLTQRRQNQRETTGDQQSVSKLQETEQQQENQIDVDRVWECLDSLIKMQMCPNEPFD